MKFLRLTITKNWIMYAKSRCILKCLAFLDWGNYVLDVSLVVPALPSVTILGYHPPFVFVVGESVSVRPLICMTHRDYDFGVWEGSTVQFLRNRQFIHHLSFSVSNHSKLPQDGHFPMCSENLLPAFQNGISPWIVCSRALKNSGWTAWGADGLVLEEDNFLGLWWQWSSTFLML